MGKTIGMQRRVFAIIWAVIITLTSVFATDLGLGRDAFASVSGKVISTPEATDKGHTYAMVAYNNGHVYTVQPDGSLKEVKSFQKSGDVITDVEIDEAMLWTWISIEGKTYLRYISEGYDYGGDQQARTFAYTYIDPLNQLGISSDVPLKDEHGEIKKVGGITQFDSPIGHTDLVLDNQSHIYHLDSGNEADDACG